MLETPYDNTYIVNTIIVNDEHAMIYEIKPIRFLVNNTTKSKSDWILFKISPFQASELTYTCLSMTECISYVPTISLWN